MFLMVNVCAFNKVDMSTGKIKLNFLLEVCIFIVMSSASFTLNVSVHESIHGLD